MKMKYVSIIGKRSGYGVDQVVSDTCTVGQLIEILEQYDENLPVVLNNDNGYTYGEINDYTVSLKEYREEEEEEEEEEEDD
jgi:hypothetical protein